jgi:predicted anti-sigma-YlaC factor YlaD
MRCDIIRQALSAHIDGEDPDLDRSVVDLHLSTCAPCEAWGEELATLHRMVRVREAEPVPDLTTTILASAPVPSSSAGRWRAEPVSGARWSLFAVALTQLVLAGPGLLLGEDSGATVHVARELGAFDVALAVGLLVAAWQPARAWGLLPLAAALALVRGATAVLDVVQGRAASLGEVHHVLDLAGVAFLWRVAHDEQPRPVATRRFLAS